MSSAKGERYSFPANAFSILQGIIRNHDGGRFLEVIVNRSSGKNFEKLGVWTEVTDLFNQVSVVLVLFCSCFASFQLQHID
jgi:hypothetical protein